MIDACRMSSHTLSNQGNPSRSLQLKCEPVMTKPSKSVMSTGKSSPEATLHRVQISLGRSKAC